MNKIILLLSLIFISSCANYKILKVIPKNEILLQEQRFCYELPQSLLSPHRIYNKKYLDKKRQSSNFYIQYKPEELFSNIINTNIKCPINKLININGISIFKRNYSDTAQWKELYFVTVDISYKDKNYKLDNVRFKDYESTGWVYVFKFQSENKIITKTIERALVRIFTDIEDAITNKLTLEQRNAKKDAKRLETEKLMDKYIKAQKELTNE